MREIRRSAAEKGCGAASTLIEGNYNNHPGKVYHLYINFLEFTCRYVKYIYIAAAATARNL